MVHQLQGQKMEKTSLDNNMKNLTEEIERITEKIKKQSDNSKMKINNLLGYVDKT